jgi:hypothetical protein
VLVANIRQEVRVLDVVPDPLLWQVGDVLERGLNLPLDGLGDGDAALLFLGHLCEGDCGDRSDN